MVFKIKICETVVEIHSLHERVYKYCEGYTVEDAVPDFTVSITSEDIEAEREYSHRDQCRQGEIPVEFSDGTLETTAVYRKICSQLISRDIFLMHGSVVAADGAACIFIAPSGTGKTTHTRLWLKNIAGSYVVNGDKPLLKVTDHTVYASGTPWSGKERMQVNESVPVKAIVLLERGAQNEIAEISFKEALPVLLSQSYRNADKMHMIKTVELLERASRTIRLYRLKCNMEDEAAIVAYNGIYKNN